MTTWLKGRLPSKSHIVVAGLAVLLCLWIGTAIAQLLLPILVALMPLMVVAALVAIGFHYLDELKQLPADFLLLTTGIRWQDLADYERAEAARLERIAAIQASFDGMAVHSAEFDRLSLELDSLIKQPTPPPRWAFWIAAPAPRDS